jgi:hypothetical protein
MTLRELLDDDGVTWQVWAVKPHAAAPQSGDGGSGAFTLAGERRPVASPIRLTAQYAEGWLAFLNGEQRRRHAPIPLDWEAMSDDELRGLLRNAEVKPGARRLIE